MNITELFDKFLNGNPRDRVLGRYNSSELYSIIKGYKKPVDHFKRDSIQPEYLDRVIRGMGAEDMMSRMFKQCGIKAKYGDNQAKYEMNLGEGITVVCKPDVEFDNEVWEFKYPLDVPTSIPDKWKYQLEMEYRSTLKPVKLMVFIEPFGLIKFDYEPSDKVYEEIKTKLTKYHKKVIELK